MANTRGLSVQIDPELHTRIKNEQAQRDITLSELVTYVFERYFDGKDGINVKDTKTLALTISPELSERLNQHLARNPGLSKKDFVTTVITKALDDAEALLNAAATGSYDDQTA